MRTLFCVVGVSTAFLGLLPAGCKKRAEVSSPDAVAPVPGVVTNRMADAVYRSALSENRREQMRKAGERSEVVEKMKALVEQTRARLPKEADDAAVKAELAKDAVWRELEAKNQSMIEEITKTLSKGRELVRQRMLAEARDVKAVKEGKARAVDPQQAKK